MKPAESQSEVKLDRILQVLALEYQNLNAQIVARLSARYQFLGFLTAGAAILAAASGQPALSAATWVLALLAAGVLGSGIFLFWYMGRIIALQATRLAEIEGRINRLVPRETADSPELLGWEIGQQGKTTAALFMSVFRQARGVGKRNLRASRNDAVFSPDLPLTNTTLARLLPLPGATCQVYGQATCPACDRRHRRR